MSDAELEDAHERSMKAHVQRLSDEALARLGLQRVNDEAP
jgi:hypothetical protein